jgi:hypothetical protein
MFNYSSMDGLFTASSFGAAIEENRHLQQKFPHM